MPGLNKSVRPMSSVNFLIPRDAMISRASCPTIKGCSNPTATATNSNSQQQQQEKKRGKKVLSHHEEEVDQVLWLTREFLSELWILLPGTSHAVTGSYSCSNIEIY